MVLVVVKLIVLVCLLQFIWWVTRADFNGFVRVRINVHLETVEGNLKIFTCSILVIEMKVGVRKLLISSSPAEAPSSTSKKLWNGCCRKVLKIHMVMMWSWSICVLLSFTSVFSSWGLAIPILLLNFPPPESLAISFTQSLKISHSHRSSLIWCSICHFSRHYQSKVYTDWTSK